MNSRLFLSFFLVVVVGSCKTGQQNIEQARFLIDSIQSQSLPDKRLGVFDIRPSMAGPDVVLRGESTDSSAVRLLIGTIKRDGISFIDSIRILPDTALGEKNFGLITLSVANLRYKAAHEAEMATQALMGTPVRILKEENNWLLVQTPDLYISWTQPVTLKRITAGELEAWKRQSRIIITDDYGLIYTQPDIKSMPVSDMIMGCILVADPALPAKPGFTGVMLPDGRTGYIESSKGFDFAKWMAGIHPTAAGIYDISTRFLGRPYLWGGTSAKAFDCSGFTKTVYFMLGLVLNRDASQQVREGSEVSLADCWKQLQTGDLLFFGRKASGDQKERVSHVGIYLGESQFIHASGMVRINSLDSTRVDYNAYYIQNLLHIKRFGNQDNHPVWIAGHKWYN